MTERLNLFCTATAGLVMVALLFLLGYDLTREVGRGPRWKRRLVAFGLYLMSACGFTACGVMEPPQVSVPPPVSLVAPPTTVMSPLATTETGLRDQMTFINQQLSGDTITKSMARAFADSVAARLAAIPDTACDYSCQYEAGYLYGEIMFSTVEGTQLAGNSDWQEIERFWHRLGEYTPGSMGTEPLEPGTKAFTLEGEYRDNRARIEQMATSGVITRTAAKMLHYGIRYLHKRAGMPVVMCYAQIYTGAVTVDPDVRAELLQRFAANGMLAPHTISVVAQEISSLRADNSGKKLAG